MQKGFVGSISDFIHFLLKKKYVCDIPAPTELFETKDNKILSVSLAILMHIKAPVRTDEQPPALLWSCSKTKS